MGIRNSPHTRTHGNPHAHSSPGNLDNVRWQLGVYNSHACNCQPWTDFAQSARDFVLNLTAFCKHAVQN